MGLKARFHSVPFSFYPHPSISLFKKGDTEPLDLKMIDQKAILKH
jgi:hypothetical protein